MKNIILASASPRRQQLLEQIGLGFKVIPSTIDEIMDSSLKPSEVAVSLATQKCKDVSAKLTEEAIVIAADTIVVKANRLLGKPKDKADALNMLLYLNGQWHEVVTGICVYDTTEKRLISGYEVTRVKIANHTDEFLKEYVETKEPLDKAGAYGIQGYGALLVEKIEGCYFNVMGLPVYKLSCILKDLGYKVNFESIK